MQKYFLSEEEFTSLKISGPDYHHITRVMRSKVGDTFIINYDLTDKLVEIENIDASAVYLNLVEVLESNSELPFFVSLFQGYPKGDKLDTIIKNSVQLGIGNIIPFLSSRTQVKINNEKVSKKTARFNKISKESAEQSKRMFIPEVLDPIKLNKIDFSSYDYIMICYEESAKNGENSAFKSIAKNIKSGERLAVIVGPEGGISEEEVIYLESLGGVRCGLGPRILRTEQAITYTLSSLSYEKELK